MVNLALTRFGEVVSLDYAIAQNENTFLIFSYSNYIEMRMALKEKSENVKTYKFFEKMDLEYYITESPKDFNLHYDLSIEFYCKGRYLSAFAQLSKAKCFGMLDDEFNLEDKLSIAFENKQLYKTLYKMRILQLDELQMMISNKDERLFVLLYCDSISRLGTNLALAKAISRKNQLVVIAVPIRMEKYLYSDATEFIASETIHFAPIAKESMRRLQGVDIFISAEFDYFDYDVSPSGAVTCAVLHALPSIQIRYNIEENLVGLFKYWVAILRTFDYIFIAKKQPKE